VGFLAMEPPTNTYHESIRDEQVKVFRMIRPLDPDHLVRGQFKGYLQEPGVKAGSQVETFGAVQLHVDSWRWEGVPFLIRAGKNLPVTTTEVLVTLKRPPLTHLAPGAGNHFRFRLSPEVEIALGARVQHPGGAFVTDTAELRMVHHPTGDDMDAYERLLGDAMAGDAMLFAREDSVEAAWQIVEPILETPTPVYAYEPGTWGPPEADRLAANIGGWHAPEPHA
jgi:glucose-6-phosphate 1-dehydrogenase